MSVVHLVVHTETVRFAIVRSPDVTVRRQPYDSNKVVRCQSQRPQAHTFDNADVAGIMARIRSNYPLEVAGVVSHNIPFVYRGDLGKMSSSENELVGRQTSAPPDDERVFTFQCSLAQHADRVCGRELACAVDCQKAA